MPPPTIRRVIQEKKSADTARISSSGMILLSMTSSEEVCLETLSLKSSVDINLLSMATRSTLKPPDVDPTQPPMTIITRKSCLDKAGKMGELMSFVENPVVVRMDTTWNAVCLNDASSSTGSKASGFVNKV